MHYIIPGQKENFWYIWDANIPIEEFSYEETGGYFGEFAYSLDEFVPNYRSVLLVTKLEQSTNTNLTSFPGCY
ncbi:hypothetical protein AFK68_11740 [Hydrocoleum sp. CS-953]|uniref:hypothetical protein n=1 Tax=Hydrocoleum sp. CS-953 TaxID=1671698 RepID=UPI000B9A6017|nr:hypothetical protein [Hydrocoleum sp. CS-953]OZH54308.1 hypothetical protein AFK68_11740 [Hydrocoleum sp. CS-953]